MLLGKQLSPNHQSITLWASRPVCLEEHLNFDEDDHSKENYEGGDHKDSLATENIPWRHKAVWWYRQISPKKYFYPTLDVWIWNGSMFGFCLPWFVYKGLSAPHISTMMTCPIQNSSFQTHQQEAISLFSTGTSIMVVIDVLFSKQCCSSSSPRICRAYMEVEHPPLACCGGRGFYWEWSGAFFPFLHRFYSSLYTADWWKRALTEIIRLQRLLSRGKWGWCCSQARSI